MKIKVRDISEADNLKVNFLGKDELKKELELAYEEVYKDYQKRKNEITTKLYTIWRNQEIPAVYREWLKQAARFIEERDII